MILINYLLKINFKEKQFSYHLRNRFLRIIVNNIEDIYMIKH